MQLWTAGGARGIELETPNLLWTKVILSSNCVPNFTTFPQAVLWAAIDFKSGRRRRIIISVRNANNNNRCLSTFGAWPLNIAASSNYGAKHKNGTRSQPTWLGASDQQQQ